MATYHRQVALFRAINVAGSKIISMTKLKTFAESRGFTNAKTILQTGNLVFECESLVDELSLEVGVEEYLNVGTSIMIRSMSEWQGIIDDNPFKDAAENDPSHLLVMFCKATPANSSIEALRSAIIGPERVHLIEKQLYVTYPDGIGRSKLTTKLIEKHLGVPCTGRNWNTVLKIKSLLVSDHSVADSSTADNSTAMQPKVSRKRKQV